MSAIKKISAFVLALILAVMPSVAAMGVSYTAKTVQTGVFQRKTMLNGSVIYLKTESAHVPVSATLAGMNVESGQEVKAGDTIATYALEVLESDIIAAANALSEARDDYEFELSLREAEIEDYEIKSLLDSNMYESRIWELKAERARLTLGRYREQAQAGIAALEAAYEAVKSSGEPKPVKSRMDGYIYNAAQIKPGTVVDRNKTIATIVDPAAMLIRVDNSSGELKYGMNVDIELSTQTSRVTANGIVVSSDNALPGALRSGYAYISCSRIGQFSGARVTAITMRVENAMLAAAASVSFKDGRNVVDILDADGTLHTRYVTKAAEYGSDAWLFAGVNEGDKLVTK